MVGIRKPLSQPVIHKQAQSSSVGFPRRPSRTGLSGSRLLHSGEMEKVNSPQRIAPGHARRRKRLREKALGGGEWGSAVLFSSQIFTGHFLKDAAPDQQQSFHPHAAAYQRAYLREI